MSNTQLEELLAGQARRRCRHEIVRINTDARPIALQVALLVPLLAGAARLRERRADEPPARSRAVGRRRGNAGRLTSEGLGTPSRFH